MEDIKAANEALRKHNRRSRLRRGRDETRRSGQLQKVLIANRGEIAKRFFQALHEEGIPSVAVVTEPDAGQSWYEFADEVIYIGESSKYTHIPTIITAAVISGANAIYPGYGFLSENPDFVERISEVAANMNKDLRFMGPPSAVMRKVGNKLDARNLAGQNDVPVFQGSEKIEELEQAVREAARIGYPVLVKLDAGGGGKGMTPVFAEDELAAAIESSRRIGRELYGDDSLYLEKLIQRPVHIEVQIFNGFAVGIRKCAVQRRNQKIVEESGHSFLEPPVREELFAAAENMARISGYADGGGAGTVEFLYDADTGRFGFLEMNTRLQVEYPVTDQSLGIDLAKWQILFFDGRADEIPFEAVRDRRLDPPAHAIECRIYAEDPENDYAPAPGTIQRLDLPVFNGVRCDFGFRTGDRVLPYYDPMIGKLIVQGDDRQQALIRLERALQDIFIRGVTSNIPQLLRIARHAAFRDPDYTNRILPDHPGLESGDEAEMGGQAAGSDRRGSAAVLFGAFAAHVRQIRERAGHRDRGLARTGLFSEAGAEELDYVYNVEFAGATRRVKFLQRSMAVFYAYIDDRFNGRVSLARIAGEDDECVIHFGNRSLHIRADRKAAYTLVRLKDRDGRVQYHRMVIQPEGSADAEDAAKIVRAPFQGTFVKLVEKDGAPLKAGDLIEKGQPLIVVSAMKMETTIHAEVDGTLAYLIEDGDLSRLQLGQTTDGRILGKSIAEGEILAMIEEEESAAQPSDPGQIGDSKAGESARYENRKGSLLESIFERDLEVVFARNPQQNLLRAVKIMESMLKGYFSHTAPGESFQSIIKQLSAGDYRYRMNRVITDRALAALDHYLRIKRVFSSNLAGDVSYYAELHLMISEDKPANYRPSRAFRKEIEPLLGFYGYRKDGHDAEEEHALLDRIYLYLYQSRSACAKRRDIVECLVHLVAAAARQFADSPAPEAAARVARIRHSIQQLLYQELSELDEGLAEILRQILASIPEKESRLDAAGDEEDRDLTALDATHPFLFFEDFDLIDLRNDLWSSLADEAPAVSDATPFWRSLETKSPAIARALDELGRRGRLRGLYSPLEDVVASLFESGIEGENPRLVVMSAVNSTAAAHHSEASDASKAERAREIWNAAVRSLQVLFALRFVGKHPPVDLPARGHRVEVFVDGPVDYTSPGGTGLSYWDLTRELEERYSFLQLTTFESALLHFQDATGNRTLQLRSDGENLSFAYCGLPDCPDPRRAPEDAAESDAIAPKDAKLFARGKWPVDVWIRESLDADSFEELIFPGIDRVPLADGAGYQPVGAIVGRGEIDGRRVVYFMKDSRIRGGATGNLEGLKYVAAAYLAYAWRAPLYVWNDGAGANIKEGVISLNRAAQGFMMNALLAQNVDADSFRRYTERNFDPTLHAVISEARELYAPDWNFGRHEALFTVAVGIGSSAGLDVYGSSQATLQVLLDSAESYRVLTGSNVIRSVTGEDITNYEIGGARIMGKWTGTADWIARDKIHLLAILRRINRVFAARQTPPGGVESDAAESETPLRISLASHSVLNEALLAACVDRGSFWTVKQEYSGAGAVIGGLARLGGNRVMLLGMRSHFGMRAAPAVIRARELLRIAARTETPRVLIFGRRWFQPPSADEATGIRARMDLLNTLRASRAPQIHIVTHESGLQLIDLNCTADAVIYVNPGAELSELARLNATFVVESISEAFETAKKVLNILEAARRQGLEPQVPVAPAASTTARTAAPSGGESSGTSVSIPAELNQPYDIIGGVIEPAFDAGSFLEFHRDMNDPALGPALVTGFARLAGRVVGVLADQPAIMGGAPDAPGTEKFRTFTELLNRRGIPLVMLSNAPGFVPGTRQERLRIQQIGGESLDVNVLGRIPVVSVVLNQNYGGRQIHAFSKFLRPGVVYIALERAHIAVMGGQAAYDLFEGRRHAEFLAAGDEAGARENHRKFMTEFDRKSRATGDAQSSQLLDWSIEDASDLRSHLVRGMAAALERCTAAFEAPLDGPEA